MRAVLALAVLGLCLTPLASASLVEDLLAPVCGSFGIPLKCFYQHDGGGNGDASDRCAAPRPDFTGVASGMVVPLDDPQDNYALLLAKGDSVSLALAAQPGLRGFVQLPTGAVAVLDLDLAVFATSDCQHPVAESAHTGAGDERVAFVAPSAGVYAVQVRVGHLLGLPVAGAPAGGPSADACDPTCQALLNGELGYRLANA